MRKLFFLFVCTIILLTGCNKDPLQKLAGNAKYPDMTKEFWEKEYNNKSELWKKGLAYCKLHYKLLANGTAIKPNCEPVINIDFGELFESSNSKITGKLDEHPLHNPIIP